MRSFSRGYRAGRPLKQCMDTTLLHKAFLLTHTWLLVKVMNIFTKSLRYLGGRDPNTLGPHGHFSPFLGQDAVLRVTIITTSYKLIQCVHTCIV